MRDGKAFINCNRFMGYDKDENGQLVINREEAKIVERIFREYVGGKGVAAICKGLERDRIPTVSGKYKWYDQKTKDISKMTAIKDIIGGGTKPLTDFNDELFEAMVEKVIILSQTEFELVRSLI